jgi:hypothetical protein
LVACREEKRFCALTKARAGSDGRPHAPELGHNTRAHVFDPGRHAGARPTRARARPGVRSSPSRALALGRARSPAPSPSPASPLSLAPASAFSPAIATRASATVASPLQPPQVEPVLRLAPLVAREVFQALGPGRTSPEARDRPHRTSVFRRRAWTELTGESPPNSLHPYLLWHPMNLSDPSN